MFSIINEISRLCNKYGEDFNWGIIPEVNGFVRELEKETDISQYSDVKAIARSYSCDDVLFMLDNNIYRIYHLFPPVFRSLWSNRCYGGISI